VITYKTDDSFFTTVISKENCFSGWPVQEWLLKYDVAKFRLIKDDEIDQNRLTLSEIQDIYPGIASIGIAMNPWARVVYRLQRTLNLSKLELNRLKEKYPLIDFTDFTSLVTTTLNSEVIKDKRISNLFLPQCHWLSWNGEQGVEYATYILRGEHIKTDIKKLKEYFCINDDSLIKFDVPKIGYRKFYNPVTRKIVGNFFGEDVENLRYKF
jgi:hypothetical protein